jgi:hypothetical protein
MKVDLKRSQTFIKKKKKKEQIATTATMREAKCTGRNVVDEIERFCSNGQLRSQGVRELACG